MSHRPMPLKALCQPGNKLQWNNSGILHICPCGAHCEHPHTLEWLIIPMKVWLSLLWSQHQLCVAFNTAWPRLASNFSQAAQWNESGMTVLMNHFIVCWCTWSWCLVGHIRYHNQAASALWVFAIVFGPVCLMLLWAFNEGHTVERQCGFNRLTMPIGKGETVIVSGLSQHII